MVLLLLLHTHLLPNQTVMELVPLRIKQTPQHIDINDYEGSRQQKTLDFCPIRTQYVFGVCIAKVLEFKMVSHLTQHRIHRSRTVRLIYIVGIYCNNNNNIIILFYILQLSWFVWSLIQNQKYFSKLSYKTKKTTHPHIWAAGMRNVGTFALFE